MSGRPHSTTVSAAIASKGDSTIDKWLLKIGLPASRKGVASRILRGASPVSIEAENVFREKLGLSPRLPDKTDVHICQTCSEKAGHPVVHAIDGDCGGLGLDAALMFVPAQARIIVPEHSKKKRQQKRHDPVLDRLVANLRGVQKRPVFYSAGVAKRWS